MKIIKQTPLGSIIEMNIGSYNIYKNNGHKDIFYRSSYKLETATKIFNDIEININNNEQD